MNDTLETDVLVLGSGLAGGVAALRAAELGARVICVSHGESATSWAQGGVVYRGPQDPESLKHDILQSGVSLNNPAAVELVANEGPKLVETWLMKRLGVAFDAGVDGNPDLALEAAHNEHRIVHVKDYTGAAIAERLTDVMEHEPSVRRVNGILVDLMTTDRNDRRPAAHYSTGHAAGAYIFDPATQQVRAIVAKTVVLATGGYSALFQHSTGPSTSRGDGIASAHRAGARTMHLEFVQFHPTALYVPGSPRALLTEALRGSGAKLLNFAGKGFVDELAPRDVVARAIHEELLHSGGAHVWLDLKAIPNLETKFPSICRMLASKGFNPLKDLIPVVPAAHYTLGGVWTDLRGATSLPGLYAAGEVACTGLHGANRLASTSLLEALVFGEKAGESAAHEAMNGRGAIDFEPRPWLPEEGPVDPALLKQDWELMRQTLWNYVGLVRSEHRLKRAERILVELRNEIEWFYKRSRLNEDLIALRHGAMVATLVLYAALRRRQSVGTHFLREGY